MQSSFTSYAIIWNWLCKPNGWWRLQYGFLKKINNTNEPMKDLVNKVKAHMGAILNKEIYIFSGIFWYILGAIFLWIHLAFW